MALAEPILAEFRREVPSIRNILARVPQEKLGWKPQFVTTEETVETAVRFFQQSASSKSRVGCRARR